MGFQHWRSNAEVHVDNQNRKVRAIIVSTTIRRSADQLRKAIKCAVEQHRRGLYFVLAAIINDEDERNEAIQELVNRNGIFVSKEYQVMCRMSDHGWKGAKTIATTNSLAIKDNIDKRVVKGYLVKKGDNRWIMKAVVKGIE